MMDILIASASRPQYLKQTVASIKKHLHYKDGFRWILHEDVVRNSDSLKVVRWAINSGFDKIKMTFPAERHGNAIKELLNMAQSRYIIRAEDDWILLKDIDLDEPIKVLDADPSINQVSFRSPTASTAKDKEVTVAGKVLTIHSEWNLIFSIWRLSFIKPRWVATTRGELSYHLINDMDAAEFLECAKDNSWLQKNLGSYWWGDGKDVGYVRHIGEDSVLYIKVEGPKKKDIIGV